MTDPSDPTIQRRQIGAELRRYRLGAQKTVVDAAVVLECSHSKISKVETGQFRLKTPELGQLLDFYGVDDRNASVLTSLNDQPRKREWWEPHRDGAPDWFRRYLSLEATCAQIREYSVEVIPGLLQCEDYARAVLRAWEPEMGDTVIRSPLGLRMARQDLLHREDPAHFTAVISESALMNRVGDKAVMRAQFNHLVTVCARPNITVHVLLFDSLPHPIVPTPFTLLSMAHFDDTVAYLEDQTSASYYDAPAEVGRYTLIFNRLRSAALDPADSLALIDRLARQSR